VRISAIKRKPLRRRSLSLEVSRVPTDLQSRGRPNYKNKRDRTAGARKKKKKKTESELARRYRRQNRDNQCARTKKKGDAKKCRKRVKGRLTGIGYNGQKEFTGPSEGNYKQRQVEQKRTPGAKVRSQKRKAQNGISIGIFVSKNIVPVAR